MTVRIIWLAVIALLVIVFVYLIFNLGGTSEEFEINALGAG